MLSRLISLLRRIPAVKWAFTRLRPSPHGGSIDVAPDTADASPPIIAEIAEAAPALDTGISADPLSLAYPRSQLVIASRVERIAPPIDGPTTTRDDEVLLSATATGRAAGMTGKLCLHPDQTEQINAALSPSTDEVAWAHAVITRLGGDGAYVQQISDHPLPKRASHIGEQALTDGR